MFDGFSEVLLILVVVLMLFGSKEIPDIARFLGKTMAQLKNASNELKSEIQNSAKDSGLDINEITGGISEEINKAKDGMNKMMNPTDNIDLGFQNPIDKVKEDIESITGPIKRQR
ncbi:twin-arginine translocase TatA/TatE family subunit [Flavobacterium ardleyense]|uniref:Twin-arginine translocase TatA/TatE family subunit n=1 Tax=Flavobacterium ardleyense TaxID=2038737 RepID=A0ABW5ZCI4_9FLAO